MSTPQTSLANARIRRECREWLTLLNSGDARATDLAHFNAWLTQDSRHRAAYEKLGKVWNEIGALHELAHLEPACASDAARALRLKPWGLIAGLAACLATVTWVAMLPRTDIAAPPMSAGVVREYTTDVAQLREITLPDGSVLVLGARSRARVEASEVRRTVRLLDGEAFFSVVHDAQRPFDVITRDALVRVLGTQFEVHSTADQVSVSVAQGVVDVAALGAPARDVSRRTLTAGQQIDVAPGGELSAVRELSATEIGAWRTGRLLYEDESLGKIVADLNRYRPRSIEVTHPALGELRITAAFRVEQIDSFVASLPSILPIAIDDAGDATYLRPAASATR